VTIKDIKRAKISPWVFAGLGREGRKPTNEEILKEIANVFQVDPEDIFSKTRKREIVDVRKAYYFMCKQFTKQSLESIGYVNEEFSQNHATVLHAIRTCNIIRQQSLEYDTLCKMVEGKIKLLFDV